MTKSETTTMRPLGLDELRRLVAPRPGPRVTVQLPLRPFPDSAQNGVLARQLADTAAKRLAACATQERRPWFVEQLGALESVVCALAQPVGSLALLLDAEHVRMLPLAQELAARVHVGESFALRPLLRALASDTRYRALAVSVRRVALFEGDARGLESVPNEGLPSSLEDALGSELTERQHALRATTAGGRSPVYYAHDVTSQEQKLDLARFHQALGRGLVRRFGSDRAPLVLVAELGHQAGLRADVRLPGLLAEGVSVSPDHLSAVEIHTRAWPLVAAELVRREQDLRGHYEIARNAGKGVDLLDDVAAAAVAGRVRRLWLDAQMLIPGRVDRATGRVLPAEGEDDVLDALAEIVLSKAGEVHVVDAAMVPSATGVAAELH